MYAKQKTCTVLGFSSQMGIEANISTDITSSDL